MSTDAKMIHLTHDVQKRGQIAERITPISINLMPAVRIAKTSALNILVLNYMYLLGYFRCIDGGPAENRYHIILQSLQGVDKVP
jgi:hypothetical protein